MYGIMPVSVPETEFLQPGPFSKVESNLRHCNYLESLRSHKLAEGAEVEDKMAQKRIPFGTMKGRDSRKPEKPVPKHSPEEAVQCAAALWATENRMEEKNKEGAAHSGPSLTTTDHWVCPAWRPFLLPTSHPVNV